MADNTKPYAWFGWRQNGVNSYTYSYDMNCWVTRMPPVTKPERKVDFIDVPGRARGLTVSEGDYAYKCYLKEIVITVPLYKYVPNPYAAQEVEYIVDYNEYPEIKAIHEWLRGDGFLVLSTEQPDLYRYRAFIAGTIEFKKIGNYLLQATIPFYCQPDRLTRNEIRTQYDAAVWAADEIEAAGNEYEPFDPEDVDIGDASEWNENQAYNLGDLCYVGNSQSEYGAYVYRCIKPNTGMDPHMNNGYWVVVGRIVEDEFDTPGSGMGTELFTVDPLNWQETVTYYVGESCVLGEMEYQCKRQNTNKRPPDNPEYWLCVGHYTEHVVEGELGIDETFTVSGNVPTWPTIYFQRLHAGGDNPEPPKDIVLKFQRIDPDTEEVLETQTMKFHDMTTGSVHVNCAAMICTNSNEDRLWDKTVEGEYFIWLPGTWKCIVNDDCRVIIHVNWRWV